VHLFLCQTQLAHKVFDFKRHEHGRHVAEQFIHPDPLAQRIHDRSRVKVNLLNLECMEVFNHQEKKTVRVRVVDQLQEHDVAGSIYQLAIHFDLLRC
jgi:hypothetical protein